MRERRARERAKGSDAPARRFALLEIELPAPLAEAALALVAGRCLGLEEEAGTAGRARLRIFWDSLGEARAARARIEAALEPIRSRTRTIADGRWAERYQRGLRPFTLGRGFRVAPAGGPADGAAERRTIVLVPGRAFGTGEHATTRMCAELLEERVRSGARWLDLGTGSGILAVVAALAGAGRVLALDSDGEALEVARAVVAANGLAHVIELRHGSTDSAHGERWDGVVANVETPFFEDAPAALAALLLPDGVLVSSGIGADDAARVGGILERAGLVAVEARTRDGWAALVHRRPAGASG